MKKENGALLLVEDDENDVFFMTRALKEAGITSPLHVAVDGQMAVDYLGGVGEFSDRAKYPLPSLIFLDLKLPRMGGHEVLAWMRQREALVGIVVLVLTTSAEERDIRNAYKLGANAFLVKPPTPDELTQLLKTVKAFWLTENVFLPAEQSRSL